MKAAELKVIGFDSNDVIATSVCTNYSTLHYKVAMSWSNSNNGYDVIGCDWTYNGTNWVEGGSFYVSSSTDVEANGMYTYDGTKFIKCNKDHQ